MNLAVVKRHYCCYLCGSDIGAAIATSASDVEIDIRDEAADYNCNKGYGGYVYKWRCANPDCPAGLEWQYVTPELKHPEVDDVG